MFGNIVVVVLSTEPLQIGSLSLALCSSLSLAVLFCSRSYLMKSDPALVGM